MMTRKRSDRWGSTRPRDARDAMVALLLLLMLLLMLIGVNGFAVLWREIVDDVAWMKEKGAWTYLRLLLLLWLCLPLPPPPRFYISMAGYKCVL
jgi:hypothetical protein